MHTAVLLADLTPALTGAVPPSRPWDLLAAVVLWGALTGAAGRVLLARERRRDRDAPPPVAAHRRDVRATLVTPRR